MPREKATIRLWWCGISSTTGTARSRPHCRSSASATQVEPKDRSVDPDVAVSRQLYALGEFVHDNLKFFLDFNAAAARQRLHAPDRPHVRSAPPRRTARSSAASNWNRTKR